MLGELAGQVHGDLPGEGDVLRPPLAGHVGQADVEVVGHPLLDLAHGDSDLALLLKDFTQQGLDRFEVEGFAGKLSIGSHSDQSPL